MKSLALAKVSPKKVEWGSAGAATALSAISVEEWDGRPAGAGRILAIMAAAGWGRYPGTAEDYARAFRAEAQRRGKRIFVARAGLTIVGYAELVLAPSASWSIAADEAYLLSVAVGPEHRASGLARALVEQVRSLAAELGRRRLIADLRWDNTASLRLADAIGARLLGPSPASVLAAAGGAPHLRYELSAA